MESIYCFRLFAYSIPDLREVMKNCWQGYGAFLIEFELYPYMKRKCGDSRTGMVTIVGSQKQVLPALQIAFIHDLLISGLLNQSRSRAG